MITELIFFSIVIIIILFLKKKKTNVQKIYIINLDKDKNRFSKIKTQLDKYKLKYERYPAIDGTKYFRYKEIDNKYISKKFKKKYNNSQKACILSHVTLWEKIKNDNKNSIILEDDVIVPYNMIKQINDYIAQLPHDWGFLFIGGNRIYGTKYSNNLVTPILNSNKNFGCFAYIINPNKITEIIKRSKNIKVTIDYFIQSKLSKHFKIFFTSPQIVTHDYDNISNILNINRNDETQTNNVITIVEN